MVTGVMAKGTEERTVANRGRFDKLSVNNASSAGNEHYVARRDESACLCVPSHARRQAEEW